MWLRRLKLRLRDKRFANHKAPCSVIWQQPLQSVLVPQGCYASDIILYSPFIMMLSIVWYLLPRTFFPFTIPSTASFSRQFLLSQWPIQLLFLLSVPALLFHLPFFEAQLNILFWLSILHAPSFSIFTCQVIPVVFAHSVVVSKFLHHTTLHSTQSTSLASSLVLFPRVRRKCFSSC